MSDSDDHTDEEKAAEDAAQEPVEVTEEEVEAAEVDRLEGEDE